MSRGEDFQSRAVQEYELTDSELELLSEVAQTLDEIDSLEDSVAAEGVTVLGSAGQTRVHPAITELRQHRLMLARLLSHLSLPDEAGAVVESFETLRARKAAQTRWALERGRQARRG